MKSLLGRWSAIVFCCVVASGARAADDPRPLPRATPESQGVSSTALLGLVEEFETRINALHSLMVVRHGRVIAEGWWAPYAAEEPHQMFSLSKSFTSTAVGLAIAEGKFSLEDPVLKFFPEAAPPTPGANLRAMRVRDLLTMSTGHHNEDLNDFPFNGRDSVVGKFLALPVAHKPGTLFVYNTPASYMLSAIVQQTTGQNVRDYLQSRLFAPLGIATPTWELSQQGVAMGGFGLNLRTEDIAKFGLLYLQHGQWAGKPVVPAAWTETATSRWMSNGSNPSSDWEQGYGFQFWRCRYNVFRGDGAHGQFCVMMPDQDTVVAITAGTRDLQGVLNVLWAKLLPALAAKGARPADAPAQAKLRARLGTLALKLPLEAVAAVPAKGVAGSRYVFSANPVGLQAVSFTAAADDLPTAEVIFSRGGIEARVQPARGEWARTIAGEAAEAALATSGAWTASDTYTFDVAQYRTPFVTRVVLKFSGDEVTAEFQPNVGPTPAAVKGRKTEG